MSDLTILVPSPNPIAIAVQTPQVVTIDLNRGEKGDLGAIGLTGPVGPAGPTGSTPLPAGEVLSALRVVSRVGNQYFYSDPASDSSVFSVVGIIKTSAAIGQTIAPINNTEIQDSSWVWVLGKPIFLGLNGALTQTVPLDGWLQIVAKPLTTNTLLIELSEPTKL